VKLVDILQRVVLILALAIGPHTLVRLGRRLHIFPIPYAPCRNSTACSCLPINWFSANYFSNRISPAPARCESGPNLQVSGWIDGPGIGFITR